MELESPLLVCGLGRSGAAAAALARGLGLDVLLFDEDASRLNALEEAPAAALASPGGFPGPAGRTTGRAQDLDELSRLLREHRPSLAVVSPGFAPSHELFRVLERHGAPWTPELSFGLAVAAREFGGGLRVFMVTGTNGKSTTTAMLASVLDGTACGNIGSPVSGIVAGLLQDRVRACSSPQEAAAPAGAGGGELVLVVESSSFQLEHMRRGAAELRESGVPVEGVVFTGFSPDHLSWHGSLEAYMEAKLHALDLLSGDGAWVVCPRNDSLGEAVAARCMERSSRGAGGVRRRPREVGIRLFRFGLETEGPDPWLDRIRGVLPYDPALVRGSIMAVRSAASAVGMDEERLLRGLRAFRPLEHRMESVPCSCGAVRVINDSKATNVDSTVYALRLVEGPLVLMLGGRGKGTGYSRLVEALRRRVSEARARRAPADASRGPAAEGCAAGSAPSHQKLADRCVVVVFGEDAPAILEALEGLAQEGLVQVEDLRGLPFEGVVEAAAGLLEPGDTLLLSPACASFDMFSSFEERGRIFKRLAAGYVARRFPAAADRRTRAGRSDGAGAPISRLGTQGYGGVRRGGAGDEGGSES